MPFLPTVPEILTPHLVVQEIAGLHTQAFSKYMTQPLYQKYLAHRMRDQHDVEGFVKRAISRQGDVKRSFFHLAAVDPASSEAIGDGFIHFQKRNEGLRACEVGWGVHPAMWQMGLGREIAEALLSLCFERLHAHQVWCKIMQDNKGSVKLAQSLGMKLRTVLPPSQTVGIVEIYEMPAKDYFERPY